MFYKERELDLTELLKQIRVKKQASKKNDFITWEKAYWQLIHITFTAFYIDHQQGHDYLNDYFGDFIKVELQSLRVVLDIVSSVLKRVQNTAKLAVPQPDAANSTVSPNPLLN
jgi:hypothetical protein